MDHWKRISVQRAVRILERSRTLIRIWDGVQNDIKRIFSILKGKFRCLKLHTRSQDTFLYCLLHVLPFFVISIVELQLELVDTGIDSYHMPINIQGEAESDKYHLLFFKNNWSSPRNVQESIRPANNDKWILNAFF